MVLSFSLFLTVSWGAIPWYTGADIVYFVAFTPLILAGPLPYSLDEWLARAAVRVPGVGEDRTRRALLAGGAAVGALVAVGLSSLFRSNSSSANAAAQLGGTDHAHAHRLGDRAVRIGISAAGVRAAKALIAASAVPVGGAKEVTDPTSGDQVWVLQLETGKYTAVDAKCPHQGCAVNFVSASAGFRCPCHQSALHLGRCAHQRPGHQRSEDDLGHRVQRADHTNLTPVPGTVGNTAVPAAGCL